MTLVFFKIREPTKMVTQEGHSCIDLHRENINAASLFSYQFNGFTTLE